MTPPPTCRAHRRRHPTVWPSTVASNAALEALAASMADVDALEAVQTGVAEAVTPADKDAALTRLRDHTERMRQSRIRLAWRTTLLAAGTRHRVRARTLARLLDELARTLAAALPADLEPAALQLVDTAPDPPPLATAYLAPVLRTGPPTSPRVRPRKAAHGNGTPTLNERAVALVA